MCNLINTHTHTHTHTVYIIVIAVRTTEMVFKFPYTVNYPLDFQTRLYSHENSTPNPWASIFLARHCRVRVCLVITFSRVGINPVWKGNEFSVFPAILVAPSFNSARRILRHSSWIYNKTGFYSGELITRSIVDSSAWRLDRFSQPQRSKRIKLLTYLPFTCLGHIV